MPKHIDDHRKDVIAGRESVECCFRLSDECEGVMPLDIAWHIITNFSRLFSGSNWSDEFPNGFDPNLLNVEHMLRAGVICCDPCKRVAERVAAEADTLKPAFAILKNTVNERANGRLQHEIAEEQARAEQQRKRALALLERFQPGTRTVKKSAQHNGTHAVAATA